MWKAPRRMASPRANLGDIHTREKLVLQRTGSSAGVTTPEAAGAGRQHQTPGAWGLCCLYDREKRAHCRASSGPRERSTLGLTHHQRVRQRAKPGQAGASRSGPQQRERATQLWGFSVLAVGTDAAIQWPPNALVQPTQAHLSWELGCEVRHADCDVEVVRSFAPAC